MASETLTLETVTSETVTSETVTLETTLYDRVGGAPALEAVLDLLHEKLQADPDTAPFFATTRMDWLKRQHRNFIAAAIGGPDVYRGRDMACAHARVAIEGRHFDRVAGMLVDCLAELGVAPGPAGEVVAVVASLKPQIVNTAAVATR